MDGRTILWITCHIQAILLVRHAGFSLCDFCFSVSLFEIYFFKLPLFFFSVPLIILSNIFLSFCFLFSFVSVSIFKKIRFYISISHFCRLLQKNFSINLIYYFYNIFNNACQTIAKKEQFTLK